MRQHNIALGAVTGFLLRCSNNMSHKIDISHLIFSPATSALNFKLGLQRVTWVVVCYVFIFTSPSLDLNINEGKIKKKNKSKSHKTPPAMLGESIIF